MECPIVYWPTERDVANLELLAAMGLDTEQAISAGLDGLAAECTPALYAFASTSRVPTSATDNDVR